MLLAVYNSSNFHVIFNESVDGVFISLLGYILSLLVILSSDCLLAELNVVIEKALEVYKRGRD